MIVKLYKEIFIFFLLFLIMSIASFWLLNGGAFAKEIRYRLFLNSPFADTALKTGDFLALQHTQPSAPVIIEEIHSYSLSIPKIGVSAPIVIPRDDSMGAILASMEEGVGLYSGSALPGDRGRAVVLGHSSRASWYRGGYATVFALLDKMEPGDRVYIMKGSKQLTYEVFSKKFLSPKETDALLSGPSEESEIDFITCYPVGSASQRTVVQAKLISEN